MGKKIFIITEYFYPVHRTDSYLVTKIAEAISENNDNVNVICSSPLLDNKELKSISGKIYRLDSTPSTQSSYSFLRKIFHLLYTTIKLSIKTLISISSHEKVFSTTNPAFFLPILILIKKIKKFELTVLVYDIFPDNLVATKVLKEDSLIYKSLKKIFKWSYNNIDRVVVIGRDMEEIVKKKAPKIKDVIFIPNWCDSESIVKTSKENNTIIKKYSLENKIVFSFVGNFGLVQGIENILESTLLVKNENFVFLFVGDGVMKEKILTFINKYNSKNIIYAGKFPQSEQNNFLNSCDVSVMSLDDKMYGLGVPSKTYYNMAVSKPLFFIGHENSEIARMINENNIGWVCRANDIKKLALTFDTICNQKNKFYDIGKKARKICEDSYDEKVILNKYRKLYK